MFQYLNEMYEKRYQNQAVYLLLQIAVRKNVSYSQNSVSYSKNIGIKRKRKYNYVRKECLSWDYGKRGTVKW